MAKKKRPVGRPREKKPKDKRVSLDLTAEQMAALNRYIASHEIPPSKASVLRELLLAMLKEKGFL